MPRLFVAIELPDAPSHQLQQLRDDNLPARWTSPAQYHLTLRFIGEVNQAVSRSLQTALAAVQGSPLRLQSGGLDVFPSRRRPRVLALRIRSTPALKALQAEVEAAVQETGLPPEKRPFSAHVTFARLKDPPLKDVRTFLQSHQDFTLDTFSISDFHLYQSELHPDGAQHTRLATYPLQAQTA